MPETLIISLNRFVLADGEDKGSIIEQAIEYPMELDLSHYMKQKGQEDWNDDALSSHSSENSSRYRLLALIYHEGEHIRDDDAMYSSIIRKKVKKDQTKENQSDT